ncbi:pyrroline-5-carboxylate reductase [Burkholderia vietnamiensis]|uniref:pyrroline-5-carboxylate reductase n=1 Tax=Burkholderia vietnamiensis TaxID=60552 RepID=UPI00264FE140|nr:pyrroline-5-carboxylate reductase [Burkholderia vietnamiensis]MDN8035935.1 pyrroline-5-carboxylate reductase [Burkholderia vietnamiensis]HDR8925045.1 NAD(P)-binding domain-containing protein [Burkholderia vietnamiensis]HDR9215299.1 NAD(P)-binding domain-containing protein [Burkholderia vietnamiensis]
MKLGFIGAGVITKAIVTGLVHSRLSFEQIALSPRNAETAAELAGLDARVRVCTSNQDVLDSSDVVCIAVVPQIAADVLRTLSFDARHHVIAFVPGFSADSLMKLVHPARRVARAIPLPAVADGKGCTAIYPADDTAKSLFDAIGGAIEVADERQFDALHTVTATMASFYAVLERQAAWLTEQGVPYGAARAFLSGYCVGLAHETTQTARSFAEMIEYLMTPGGLNEQLHAELSSHGAYDHYGKALDRVLARVQGRT